MRSVGTNALAGIPGVALLQHGVAPFHTIEEMRELSNFAHRAEGLILLAAAGIALWEAWTARRRYRTARRETPVMLLLWPAVVAVSGAFLLAFLLFPHHGLSNAAIQYEFIFTDPQQRQHVAIAVLGTIGAGAELASRLRATPRWVPYMWPLALALTAAIFLSHVQHGTTDAVQRAVAIHRWLGVSFLVAAAARVAQLRAPAMKWWPLVWPAAVGTAAVLLLLYREPAGAYGAEGGEHPASHADTTGVATPSVEAVSRSFDETGASWSPDSVVARLRAAGLDADVRGRIRQPFLTVPGARITAPGAEIQVYAYEDPAAAARDAAPLDRSRVAPPTMMITWTARPSLTLHGNVIAIILTDDESLRARIDAAVVARGRQ